MQVLDSSTLFMHSCKKVINITLSIALNTTLLQARINAQGNIRRNHGPKALDISTIQRLHATERSADNIRPQVEEALGNSLNARIGIVEASNKHGIRAVGVELDVDGALREHSHLELGQCVGDGRSAILFNKVGDEAALGNKVELRGTVVNMGSVHATGAEETDCHGGAVANEGREGLGCGGDGNAAFAFGFGASYGAVGVEVEYEVTGLVEKLDAVGLCWGSHELGNEVDVVGPSVDLDDGRKVGVGLGVSPGGSGGSGASQEQERGDGRQMHFEKCK